MKLKLFFAVILIGAFLAVSRGPWFLVKKIDCQLNQYPCPLNLEPILLNFVGRSIFTLNSGEVTRQLSNFDSTLTEIQLKKQLPDKIRLDLFRRQPLAEVKSTASAEQEKVYYLDKSGFIFVPIIPIGSKLPELRWPTELGLVEGETPFSQNAAQLINTLAAYYVSFEVITRLPEPVYLVKTTLGPEALVNAEGDFAATVGSLQFILSHIKMEDKLPVKIDLRFDKPILTY